MIAATRDQIDAHRVVIDNGREVVERQTIGAHKNKVLLLSVPTPCFSTALAFYDGYHSQTLPANLIQAQRDYFGAHTYKRLDAPGNFVHTNWTGKGGNVSSSTYNA